MLRLNCWDVKERTKFRGSHVSVIDCDMWNNDGMNALIIGVLVLSMCEYARGRGYILNGY